MKSPLPCLFLLPIITSFRIGIVPSRMYTSSNTSSVLFVRSVSECLCAAFDNSTSSTVMINFYLDDHHCEFFEHYPTDASMLSSHSDVTIFMRPYVPSSTTAREFCPIRHAVGGSLQSDAFVDSLSTVSLCTTISVGSSTALWSTSTRTGFSAYTCSMFLWTAPATKNITLAIRMRNDPGYWFLDDVSVTETGIEKLVNGGFETGSLLPWVRTTPNGTCGGHAGDVTNNYGSSKGGMPRTGTYFVNDGRTGCFDQIGQTFEVNIGTTYAISFWLKASNHTSTGPIFAGVYML